MSLKAQFELGEARSELCSCSQSFRKAPEGRCQDMSRLKRERLGDHGARLVSVRWNPWSDPVRGVRAGMDPSPHVGGEEDEHGSCSSQASVEQVPQWQEHIVQWQPGVSKAWGCCFAWASLHPSLEQSVSTMAPAPWLCATASLQPESPDFPVPWSKTHITVSGTSGLEGEEGWDLVSPRLGELLGVLGLGCLSLSSWQPSFSALQTGSSLLLPQPE